MTSLGHHFRNRLLTGLVVLGPAGVTAWLLWLSFRILDGLLSPLFDKWLGFHVPGLGLLAVLVLVYVVGLLATNILGRQLVRMADGFLQRLPVVRPIYLASRQVIETLRLPGKGAFQRVVLLEYPRPGLWAIGFVTGTARRESDGLPLLNVFLPTTPNPTSGMMVITPESEVLATDLSIEAGIRLVVSGGILSPPTYPLRHT